MKFLLLNPIASSVLTISFDTSCKPNPAILVSIVKLVILVGVVIKCSTFPFALFAYCIALFFSDLYFGVYEIFIICTYNCFTFLIKQTAVTSIQYELAIFVATTGARAEASCCTRSLSFTISMMHALARPQLVQFLVDLTIIDLMDLMIFFAGSFHFLSLFDNMLLNVYLWNWTWINH